MCTRPSVVDDPNPTKLHCRDAVEVVYTILKAVNCEIDTCVDPADLWKRCDVEFSDIKCPLIRAGTLLLVTDHSPRAADPLGSSHVLNIQRNRRLVKETSQQDIDKESGILDAVAARSGIQGRVLCWGVMFALGVNGRFETEVGVKPNDAVNMRDTTWGAPRSSCVGYTIAMTIYAARIHAHYPLVLNLLDDACDKGHANAMNMYECISCGYNRAKIGFFPLGIWNRHNPIADYYFNCHIPFDAIRSTCMDDVISRSTITTEDLLSMARAKGDMDATYALAQLIAMDYDGTERTTLSIELFRECTVCIPEAYGNLADAVFSGITTGYDLMQGRSWAAEFFRATCHIDNTMPRADFKVYVPNAYQYVRPPTPIPDDHKRFTAWADAFRDHWLTSLPCVQSSATQCCATLDSSSGTLTLTLITEESARLANEWDDWGTNIDDDEDRMALMIQEHHNESFLLTCTETDTCVSSPWW